MLRNFIQLFEHHLKNDYTYFSNYIFLIIPNFQKQISKNLLNHTSPLFPDMYVLVTYNLHFPYCVCGSELKPTTYKYYQVHLGSRYGNLIYTLKSKGARHSKDYYTYAQLSFLKMIGFVVGLELATIMQVIILLCLVCTSFPTTSALAWTSNCKLNGIWPLVGPYNLKFDPAPYIGILFPFKFTRTIRWLFLGW